MEELSWGQRIIGFASPEYFRARNSQSELNFHNLAGFQNSDYSDTWFYLGLKLGLLYCGIAWLLVPKRLASRFKSTIGFFVPSQVLCLYFLLPVLLYQCDPCRALGGPAIWQQNEIIEIPGYLGALLFFGLGVLRIRSTSPVKTEESMVAGESRD
jgi:hypothetical protein